MIPTLTYVHRFNCGPIPCCVTTDIKSQNFQNISYTYTNHNTSILHKIHVKTQSIKIYQLHSIMATLNLPQVSHIHSAGHLTPLARCTHAYMPFPLVRHYPLLSEGTCPHVQFLKVLECLWMSVMRENIWKFLWPKIYYAYVQWVTTACWVAVSWCLWSCIGHTRWSLDVMYQGWMTSVVCTLDLPRHLAESLVTGNSNYTICYFAAILILIIKNI